MINESTDNGAHKKCSSNVAKWNLMTRLKSFSFGFYLILENNFFQTTAFYLLLLVKVKLFFFICCSFPLSTFNNTLLYFFFSQATKLWYTHIFQWRPQTNKKKMFSDFTTDVKAFLFSPTFSRSLNLNHYYALNLIIVIFSSQLDYFFHICRVGK